MRFSVLFLHGQPSNGKELDLDFSLEDLETIKVIGKGSGGVVQLVRHKWVGKLFALKVIIITWKASLLLSRFSYVIFFYVAFGLQSIYIFQCQQPIGASFVCFTQHSNQNLSITFWHPSLKGTEIRKMQNCMQIYRFCINVYLLQINVPINHDLSYLAEIITWSLVYYLNQNLVVLLRFKQKVCCLASWSSNAFASYLYVLVLYLLPVQLCWK